MGYTRHDAVADEPPAADDAEREAVEAAVERIQKFRGTIRLLAAVKEDRDRFARYIRVRGEPTPEPCSELLDADLGAVLDRLQRLEQERLEEAAQLNREWVATPAEEHEADVQAVAALLKLGDVSFRGTWLTDWDDAKSTLQARFASRIADLAAPDRQEVS